MQFEELLQHREAIEANLKRLEDDLTKEIDRLTNERSRIKMAIANLGGKPLKAVHKGATEIAKRLTPEGRNRLSQLMKERQAAWKEKREKEEKAALKKQKSKPAVKMAKG